MQFVFPKLKPKLSVHRFKKRFLSKTKFLNRRFVTTALYLAAALGLAFAIGVSVGEYSLNKRLAKQAEAQVHQASLPDSPQTNTAPSTTKPTVSSLDQYTVASDTPQYIIVPKLSIKARVLTVGLTKDGAVDTPRNVYDTAWYNGSAKPGQPGAALIDGHVAGWNTPGIFYNLSKLQPGDTFSVELGSGQVLNYQVVKTQNYSADQVDMAAVLSPITNGASGLNLITCSGHITPGTNEFNQRTVVFALEQ